ncbi:MAG TPA: hypothetical protein VMT86_15090 [Bryobacteraceae bacterium]|nr:hypothetical protein [Terriglobales bacterium]HVN05745.1 hypothetical protein [Bryobacteraceae bacterium]HVP45056.1 hypothetical protein [Bryobacteraceae bacterium]
MNITRKMWLPAACAAAVLSLIGAGLATARYESHKAANSTDAAVASSTGDNPSAAPDTETLVIPAGTSIRVQLDQSLDSARNRSGDVFDAHLVEPVVIGNEVVIPEKTPVRGMVADARPSGHFRHPGVLEVSLTKIQVDGNWREIATSDDFRKGGNHKKNNAGWIGGGAGGGALIGAIAAGGKGALIGGPIGAGAGTAVAFFTGKRNVHLPAESQLVFHLSQPLSVNQAPRG